MARLRPVAVRVLPSCRGRVAASDLRRTARRALAAEGIAPEIGVEVVLADEETVRELNRLYRGRDEPADVLSFADREGEAFVEAPGEPASLGQVIVCLAVAEAQASAALRAVDGEVAHLLVHGLLHILGYDHEEREPAQRMKEREDQLLADLGYADSYEHGH